MSMALRFETTSSHQWGAMIFYAHHQTFNLVIITPALAAGNFASDSFIAGLHKVYAFILPTLLAMLQIQSNAANSNTTSLFQVHSVTTGAAVFGLLAYYLAFMASLRFPLYAKSSIAMAIFGSLSLASLVTLLLPDSWGHVRYVFYVLLAVIELHQLLKVLYDKYVKRFILVLRSRLTSSASPILPLTRNA